MCVCVHLQRASSIQCLLGFRGLVEPVGTKPEPNHYRRATDGQERVKLRVCVYVYIGGWVVLRGKDQACVCVCVCRETYALVTQPGRFVGGRGGSATRKGMGDAAAVDVGGGASEEGREEHIVCCCWCWLGWGWWEGAGDLMMLLSWVEEGLWMEGDVLGKCAPFGMCM